MLTTILALTEMLVLFLCLKGGNIVICPYRDKTETTIQKETYHFSDDNLNIGTDIVTKTIHQPMECVKAECGAYHNGKCTYNQ